MATAAIIGGAALVGSTIAKGRASKKVAKSNVKAEKIKAEQAQKALEASQGQQAIENARAEALAEPALKAQNTQLALLGQDGDQAAIDAANTLTNSPLVAAINQQNQQNINAQASASGVSGGNLLKALQDANTATILQAGFGGLGQVAGQQQAGALGFAGLASNALGMANQQQNLYGLYRGNEAQAKGISSAIPWLVGADLVGQVGKLGVQAAMSGVGSPAGAGSSAPPAISGGEVGQASAKSSPLLAMNL